MVDDSIRKQSAIICHDTLTGPEARAVCRGFYDVHSQDSWPLQVAARLDRIDWTEPPTH